MIEAHGLTFGYDSKSPIVEGLTASFQRGQMSALTGRSGSGKSTLLYLLALMLGGSTGSLTVDGVEMAGVADWRRAQMRATRMGFVFQDALLDPARSIHDNVLEGALFGRSRPTSSDVQSLLDQFQVTVDPWRKPGQISGGQAQRVALCRALISRPDILFADEPTGNLDDDSAEVVWAALREHADEGGVVIVATHDRERAATCDAILDVSHGNQR